MRLPCADGMAAWVRLGNVIERGDGISPGERFVSSRVCLYSRALRCLFRVWCYLFLSIADPPLPHTDDTHEHLFVGALKMPIVPTAPREAPCCRPTLFSLDVRRTRHFWCVARNSFAIS